MPPRLGHEKQTHYNSGIGAGTASEIGAQVRVLLWSVGSGAEAPESEGRDLVISVSRSGRPWAKLGIFGFLPDDRNLGLRMTGEERVKGTGEAREGLDNWRFSQFLFGEF
jgi:hypothetical protein